MKFINYIFISWFRVYCKYEKKKWSDPQFHAVCATFICIVSLCAVPIGVLSQMADLKSILPNWGRPIAVLIAGGVLFLMSRYYSEGRIKKINEEYEKQSVLMRRLWVWISVFIFIGSFILFALLINKTI
ncbi:MAG TPA: hypothetical protein VG847_13305 [Chitinophagaceae bacterium]|nr:hypothetical protein [Chitinophagaceae bacterium]